MSKILYVHSRSELNSVTYSKVADICEALIPDMIESDEIELLRNEHSCYGITLPANNIEVRGESVLVGYLFEKMEQWDTPFEPFPDGAYALFRNNSDYLEVVSDPIGSKTIWYYRDQEKFIASTSQRAIVMFIGKFNPDKKTIPWVLSSGSLGPGNSWDTKIKCIPQNSSVRLDKNRWMISIKEDSYNFVNSGKSKKYYKTKLRNAYKETFAPLNNVDFSKIGIALSGGKDSRSILKILNHFNINANGLQAVTWGKSNALNRENNDAVIAPRIAIEFNLKHTFYPIIYDLNHIERVFDRFMKASEGRTDQFTAYMDGLAMWNDLRSDQIRCLIRGDVSFIENEARAPSHIREVVGLSLCSDYRNLRRISEQSGLPEQSIPQNLLQRKDESILTWRDRVRITYRHPVLMSALTDIKLSFIEHMNPLLSRKIIDVTREMPDELRSNKELFQEVVDELYNDNLPYATSIAGESRIQVLTRHSVVSVIISTLQSELANEIFGSETVEDVIENLRIDWFKPLKRSIPEKLRLFLKKAKKKANSDHSNGNKLGFLDVNILAFRMFMVIKMYEILNKDSLLFSRKSSSFKRTKHISY